MSSTWTRGASATVGRSERRGNATVAAASVSAVVIGILTALDAAAAAAVAGGLAVAAVLFSTRSILRPIELGGKRFTWVTFAWAFLLVEPIGHFTTGRSRLTAVAGVPSVENVLELTTYGVIAAFAVFSMKRNGIDRRPSLLILAFPILALLSSAWSLAPSVTLAFSFELLAVVLLATLTSAILSTDSGLGRSLLQRTLRLTVQGIALLCVIGLIFRSGWVLDPGTGGARFTWPGGYPLAAAAEIGLALLIIVFGGRRDTGFSWPSCAALLVLFSACLYLANARTAFAGLVVAALFGCWYVSKGGDAIRRLAGAAAIAATVFVLVGSFGGPITHYLYRGESQEQVSSLNGRLGLWTIGVQQLHGPGRWLVGYGLNGTRVLFASTTAWAGDAHSAWLELLISLGLLGVVCAAALVAVLTARLVRAPPDGPLGIRVLAILFVFVLAMSPIGAGFGAPGPEPGLGFAVLAICYAATAMRERAPSRAAATQGARLRGALQPAST